jgi:co-chaperonin GroES (HSP10)
MSSSLESFMYFLDVMTDEETTELGEILHAVTVRASGVVKSGFVQKISEDGRLSGGSYENKVALYLDELTPIEVLRAHVLGKDPDARASTERYFASHPERDGEWRGSNKGAPCEFGTPVGTNLILEFTKVEEITESGIVLASETVAKEGGANMVARVLAIGAAAWADQPCDYCDVGDRVVLARYTGVKLDGAPKDRDVRFATDMQILAVAPKSA